MQIEQPDLLLDPAAVAALFSGVSRRQVLQWARDGELPSVKLSRKCVRFRPADIQAFVESRTRDGECAQRT